MCLVILMILALTGCPVHALVPPLPWPCMEHESALIVMAKVVDIADEQIGDDWFDTVAVEVDQFVKLEDGADDSQMRVIHVQSNITDFVDLVLGERYVLFLKATTLGLKIVNHGQGALKIDANDQLGHLSGRRVSDFLAEIYRYAEVDDDKDRICRLFPLSTAR